MTVAHITDRAWLPTQPWACPGGQLVMSAMAAMADRQTWLEERRKGLGASDVAAVFGVSKWSTAWDVWAEKLGKLTPEPETEAQRRGRILEDGIADLWVASLPADEPVRLQRKGLMRSRRWLWMLATVDRLSACRKGRCITEIKSSNDLREWDGDETPVAYQLQTQQQLAVTGRDHAHVVVLGDRFRLVERLLPRDDELISSMGEHLSGWWQRHIVEAVEPEATAGAAEGLARLYGNPDPDAVCDLPPDLATASDDVRAFNKQIADLTEARDHIVARVKQTAGNASVIRSLGQTVATWRPSKTIDGATKAWRSTNRELVAPYVHTGSVEVVDVDALVHDHPDLLGDGGPLRRRRSLNWKD